MLTIAYIKYFLFIRIEIRDTWTNGGGICPEVGLAN